MYQKMMFEDGNFPGDPGLEGNHPLLTTAFLLSVEVGDKLKSQSLLTLS